MIPDSCGSTCDHYHRQRCKCGATCGCHPERERLVRGERVERRRRAELVDQMIARMADPRPLRVEGDP